MAEPGYRERRAPGAPLPRLVRETRVVAGRRIAYRVTGTGEPVILVHGLAGSTRWWMPILPALAARYRVYLVDLPGFGSLRRGGWLALEGAAAWLLAWQEAAEIGPAHLVGHSMGGYISMRVAATRPAAVRRLVLIDPVGVPPGRGVLHHLLPVAQESLGVPRRFLPVVLGDALRAGPRRLWRTGRAILAADARAWLAAIRAPTLLIWGAADRLVLPGAGPVLRAAIPDARLLIIPGARHVPMFDRPAAVSRALLAFLAGGSVGE